MTAGARSLGYRTALFERVVAYSTRPTDTRGDVSGAESRGPSGLEHPSARLAGRPARGRHDRLGARG